VRRSKGAFSPLLHKGRIRCGPPPIHGEQAVSVGAGATVFPMVLSHRTRSELFLEGWSRRRIDSALTRGELVRARRDRYLPGDTPDAIVRAVRVGGRLTCLSLLRMMGVFVRRNDRLHVHMHGTDSRMRSPHDRRQRLEPRHRRGVRLHWLALTNGVGQATCVGMVDALVHAVLCQSPRDAIATLDSALNKRLVTPADIAEVFGALPARYGALLPLLDGDAESGPESLMRLMLRMLGCRVEVQVVVEGVGRVDLVVDGWLVIECDSRQFHEGWEAQEEDRRRDLALAALGYTTIRPTATMIMDQPEVVLAAVRGLMRSRRA
jgi:very-short-patch-repair endonuclease